jgi:hypothetical protein
LVIQRGQYFGLALEARQTVRVARERFRQHLERHVGNLQCRANDQQLPADAPRF